MNCDEANEPAPRLGCGCRECYRAREYAIDPRLIAIVRDDVPRFDFASNQRPSRHVIRRCLEYYLMGRVEWASLYIEIIKALAEQNDNMFDQQMSMVNRLPFPHVIQSAP